MYICPRLDFRGIYVDDFQITFTLEADTGKCRRCPHIVSLFFLCYESRATTEAEIEYQIYIWRITHDDGLLSFFVSYMWF